VPLDGRSVSMICCGSGISISGNGGKSVPPSVASVPSRRAST
jgi:hypothetical protein